MDLTTLTPAQAKQSGHEMLNAARQMTANMQQINELFRELVAERDALAEEVARLKQAAAA